MNPWDGEPDLKEWTDEGTGYKCLILRNPDLGHLCGYVGLPQDHPLHGVGYNDLPADVDVHGGPSAAGRPGMKDFGADPDYWWVGFDCAHASDLIPAYPIDNCQYRDMDYVKNECARLAEQLQRIHGDQ